MIKKGGNFHSRFTMASADFRQFCGLSQTRLPRHQISSVGSRTGLVVAGGPSRSCAFWFTVPQYPRHTLSPTPTTSNPACGFPARGFPVNFTSRVKVPVGWKHFRTTVVPDLVVRIESQFTVQLATTPSGSSRNLFVSVRASGVVGLSFQLLSYVLKTPARVPDRK